MKFSLIVFTLSITIPFVAFGQDEGEYECCLLQDANCGKKGVDADKAVMNALRVIYTCAHPRDYCIISPFDTERYISCRCSSGW